MAGSAWLLRRRRISTLPNVRKDRETIITIGFFASQQAAQDDIASYRHSEGFVDYPGGWNVLEPPLDMLLEVPVRFW